MNTIYSFIGNHLEVFFFFLIIFLFYLLGQTLIAIVLVSYILGGVLEFYFIFNITSLHKQLVFSYLSS